MGRVFALILALSVLTGGARLSRAADVVGEPLPADCMSSDQVRPGMIGEGRTVFKGYKVEPFKVEILGVQHNALPGCNMILARLYGPYLDKHGVVAGMSGSPVYVNGKIIGAVAYGWSGAYEPYCGITPIEQMWTVFQAIGTGKAGEGREAGGESAASGGASAGGALGAWDWQSAWRAYQGRLGGKKGTGGAGGGFSATAAGGGLGASVGAGEGSFRPTLPALAGKKGEMRPLAAPLYLSGASAASERLLRNFFAGEGVELMGGGVMAGSGGGGGAGDEKAPPLEHGSAIGVPILSGDLSLSGVGTVTYVKGDKLIAFGHPMFFRGATAAPMANAYIFGFMESYERSFKLGDVRDEIGTIDQDRQFAIGGRVGGTPPRLPITVNIHGSAASRPRPFNFSCWKNRSYVPMMTAVAMQEAFASSVAETGELSAEVRYTITLADGRKIEKRFHETTRETLLDGPLMSVLFDLFVLMENPYEQAEIARVEADIAVEPGFRQELLVSARLDRPTCLAGETVNVVARLRPWRGPEYERTIPVAVPAGLAPGSYVLHVADSVAALRIERAHHPERYLPRDFNGVVELTQQANVPDDELRLYLFEPALDLNLDGQQMGNLPSSMATLIQSTAPAQLQQQSVGRLLDAQTLHAGQALAGAAALTVQVVNHFDE